MAWPARPHARRRETEALCELITDTGGFAVQSSLDPGRLPPGHIVIGATHAVDTELKSNLLCRVILVTEAGARVVIWGGLMFDRETGSIRIWMAPERSDNGAVTTTYGWLVPLSSAMRQSAAELSAQIRAESFWRRFM